MNLDIKEGKSSLIVQLAGELDHHSTEIIRNRIDRSYKESEKTNIVLDLNGITFIDSSGIGLIMGRFQKVKSKQGQLLVVSQNKYVDRIMNMSGLLKIVEVFPDLKAAGEILERGEKHGR